MGTTRRLCRYLTRRSLTPLPAPFGQLRSPATAKVLPPVIAEGKSLFGEAGQVCELVASRHPASTISVVIDASQSRLRRNRDSSPAGRAAGLLGRIRWLAALEMGIEPLDGKL